jgi:hypothetical protein
MGITEGVHGIGFQDVAAPEASHRLSRAVNILHIFHHGVIFDNVAWRRLTYYALCNDKQKQQ